MSSNGDISPAAPSHNMSGATEIGTPSRSGTVNRKQSLRKRVSLRRTRSGRSLRAGSMKGGHDHDDFESVFHTPIPTSGTPTDILAERFQAWRKLLKDLITYFREIQTSYETRSKALLKIANVLNNTTTPSIFMSEDGIDEATKILRQYHKQAVNEANKAKDIEDDVVTQLSGLRSDLNQKIKEIRSLSGDFKNSVDKEKDNTRKAVNHLQDALATAESDPASASGKNDPFIVRLAVERQVEKQIEEENYLHRAYLNLEGSGRELESIVVGEIQKAYNAYAGILRRESESAHKTIEDLRAGPLTMPKDREWDNFVRHDPHFIDPDIPLRKISRIDYPGRYEPAASEIRSGPLERKSKYLKSYTPGWYVLSPTHLHEFKSPDHLHTQQPVMSLFLLDQKLGSHSQSDGSSNKFSLKGKQTGGIRGHSWVFRAESYDTMMAWYEDIRNLTEKTGVERNAFVRRHARSVSGGSHKAETVSSDGLEEDDADRVPYQAVPVPVANTLEVRPQRPAPGGRFPSDMDLTRDRTQEAPLSVSGSSDDRNEPTGSVALAAAQSADARKPSTASSVAPVQRQTSTGIAPIVSTVDGKQDQISELDAAPPSRTTESTTLPVQSQTSAPAPIASPAVAAVSLPAEPKSSVTHADTAPTITNEAAPEIGVTDAQDFAATDPIRASQSADTADAYGPVAQRTRDAMAATNPSSSVMTDSEREHFHRTGHLLPSVLRHDTAMSASELHVPGEYTTRPQ